MPPKKHFPPRCPGSSPIPAPGDPECGRAGLRYPLQLAGRRRAAQHRRQSDDDGRPAARGEGHHITSRFVELLESREPSTQEGRFRCHGRNAAAPSKPRAGASRWPFPTSSARPAPVSGVESLLDYDVTLIVDSAGQAPQLCLSWWRGDQPVPVLRRRSPPTARTTSAPHITLEAACAPMDSSTNWCASPRTRPPARSSACSSGRTKSG